MCPVGLLTKISSSQTIHVQIKSIDIVVRLNKNLKYSSKLLYPEKVSKDKNNLLEHKNNWNLDYSFIKIQDRPSCHMSITQ